VTAAAACIAFWETFSDFVLPIDPCNPWNTAIVGEKKDRNSSSAGEKSATNRAADQSDTGADDDGIGGIIADGGYEVADDIDANSLTIDELLRRAMTDCASYAILVPASFNDDRTSPIQVTIESCPPTITSVSTFGSFVESHLFANTPVVVEVGLLYSTCVRITWFADREQVFPDGPCYTPTENDVDKVLTVLIVPRRPDHDGRGCEEAYQFQRRVEALPALPIVRPLREGFMNRPSHDARPSRQRRHHRRDTTGREDDPTMSLRVVSYNILADQYSSRDVDKKDDADRMYSHCKYEYLTKWRRHPLIVHEILAYQPDVVALQEVDADVFAYLLKPVLTAKGYEGYFSPKGGGAYPGVGEGCAIFWSLEVFDSVRPVDMRTRTFREMFQEFSCEEHINTHTSQWKSLKDMSKLLEKHHELKHVLFNKLGHVMQTVVLTQRQSQEKLVIGNTHLFYHPMASHIRCLKMLIASRQLEIEHRENQYCPIILCGDLNSHPQSGVMKLLLDRYLNANNGQTWKHLCTFDWEETQGAGVRRDVEAIDLELPPSFPTFLSGYPTPPDFTHYIEAFICTLDYILVTNNFEVEKAGATPTRDDVRKFIAMPNECMPSDHVSLVCDLVWR
jgi:mRNA deadenylase 3'-5' endonuclease subunit Ccr4